MAKPVLLSVDDDRDVLRAIERDLRSQYGADYRVWPAVPARSARSAEAVKVRNDSVALLLADQRMPNMDGVGFLQQAMQHLSGRQAGAAYCLRRYHRRHQRHQ